MIEFINSLMFYSGHNLVERSAFFGSYNGPYPNSHGIEFGFDDSNGQFMVLQVYPQFINRISWKKVVDQFLSNP